tara:strand:- start:270 stop:752 length:483 start_codon:yes stop_codon:yes gene_type:complete
MASTLTVDEIVGRATAANIKIPGHVVQVVQGTLGSAANTNSGSYTDTGLTATITPISATSKILVITSASGAVQDNATSDETANVNLVRGSTQISEFQTQIRTRGGSGGESAPFFTGFSFLDSPSTTSATTYKTQMKVATAEVLYFNLSGTATITLMEIAQ